MGKASQYLRALSWTFKWVPAPSQTNWSSDDDDAAAAAEAARTEIINHRSNVDTKRIANDVLNMTREEVILRLRELIDSPTLETN